MQLGLSFSLSSSSFFFLCFVCLFCLFVFCLFLFFFFFFSVSKCIFFQNFISVLELLVAIPLPM
jgi:hypothetical protein